MVFQGLQVRSIYRTGDVTYIGEFVLENLDRTMEVLSYR